MYLNRPKHIESFSDEIDCINAGKFWYSNTRRCLDEPPY